MSLPTPEAGLVIPYNYLWRHEHRKGRDEGRKTRPAVIVLVVQKAEGDAPRVTVAPITHTPPDATTEAIELPRASNNTSILTGNAPGSSSMSQ